MKQVIWSAAVLIALSMSARADDQVPVDDLEESDPCVLVEFPDGSFYLWCDQAEIESVRARGSSGRF